MIEGDDVVLRILHTADWHLGKSFKSFDDEDEGKLARARFDAVARALQLAEQYRVDAMLCAGDLFDLPDPPSEVVDALLEIFRTKERDFPVLLLPGNHDPLTTTSVYREGGRLRASLPGYVRVVDRDDFSLALGDEGVVYAVPCRSKSGQSDPTEKIPRRETGDRRVRIGMVHGQTFHFPEFQTTFPISKDAARQAGLDYLALGDTHAFQNVAEGGPPMVYRGALEPSTFGETGAGFAAVVLLRRHPGAPSIQQERVGRWRWRQETCRSVGEVRALLQEPELRHTVLKLTLDLKGTLRELEDLETMLRSMKDSSVNHGRVGILRLERDRLELDLSPEEGDETLPAALQSVVARLQGSEAELGPVASRAIQHLYRTFKDFR